MLRRRPPSVSLQQASYILDAFAARSGVEQESSCGSKRGQFHVVTSLKNGHTKHAAVIEIAIAIKRGSSSSSEKDT